MYIFQIERFLLKEHIKKNSHYLVGKILDVGSGEHLRYKNCFDDVTEYVTLDINSSLKPDMVGSAEKIPTKSEVFDGILCNQVIGDIINPFAAVAEFYRVLKVGGKVILTEGFMNELHGEPIDYWRFTPFGLRKIFEQNNFNVLKVELIGGVFSVTHQMWVKFFINSFNLYNHKIIGRIFSKLSYFSGNIFYFLDKKVNKISNKKIGLNIIIVAEKIG